MTEQTFTLTITQKDGQITTQTSGSMDMTVVVTCLLRVIITAIQESNKETHSEVIN